MLTPLYKTVVLSEVVGSGFAIAPVDGLNPRCCSGSVRVGWSDLSWNWSILDAPLDWFSVFGIVSTLDDDGFCVVDEEPSLETDGPGLAWSAVPSEAFAV